MRVNIACISSPSKHWIISWLILRNVLNELISQDAFHFNASGQSTYLSRLLRQLVTEAKADRPESKIIIQIFIGLF